MSRHPDAASAATPRSSSTEPDWVLTESADATPDEQPGRRLLLRETQMASSMYAADQQLYLPSEVRPVLTVRPVSLLMGFHTARSWRTSKRRPPR